MFVHKIDCSRFPIKRVLGEEVVVEADVFTDGHDEVICHVLYRHGCTSDWSRSPMTHIGNDRWRGVFRVSELGHYQYTVEAWVDRFGTWRRDLVGNLIDTVSY